MALFARSLIIATILERKKLTLDEFITRLKNDSSTADVFEFFDEKIAELSNAGQAGNASIYTSARNALRKFAKEKKLAFADINYRYLMNFENYLRIGGARDGGISNYMRTVRALFNEAIRRGIADQASYPFSTQFNKNGYSIAKLKIAINPRAMTVEELTLIKNFNYPTYAELAWAFQIFMFSFYEFGINFADIARLTWANIQGEHLRYVRKKTKKEYNIPPHPEARKIIKYFKGKDLLFPILLPCHKTEEQKLEQVTNKRKAFNDAMREIGKILGIKTNLTSYVARHTSATTLKRNGVSEDVISEALGHSDVVTTKRYLAHFENEVLKKASERL